MQVFKSLMQSDFRIQCPALPDITDGLSAPMLQELVLDVRQVGTRWHCTTHCALLLLLPAMVHVGPVAALVVVGLMAAGPFAWCLCADPSPMGLPSTVGSRVFNFGAGVVDRGPQKWGFWKRAQLTGP